VGFCEGISFLVLLGIAMPIKYLAGEKLPVLIVGWAHGVLFMLYIAAVVAAARTYGWSAGKIGLALLAAIIPAGPFLIDHRLATWGDDLPRVDGAAAQP
jgi:integral membrane protein